MPISFLHPLLFAIGAACVSIPIIIHLLKRRRRVVSWGAMRFLEEAYRKRRRIITLEQLILLSLRCLLVLLIAMGVGAIFFGSAATSRSAKTLIIVLDDSIASAREVDGAAVFEQHQRSAIEQIEALDPMLGDRVALITASRPAQPVVFPASDDLGAVRRLIEQSTPTDAGFDLQGVFDAIKQLEVDPDRPARTSVLIASDVRPLPRAIERLGSTQSPIELDELFLPVPESTPSVNVGIVNADTTRTLHIRDGVTLPGAIRVSMHRSGEIDSESETQIRVMDAQGQTRSDQRVTWRNGQREQDITLGLQTVSLEPFASSSALLRVELSNDANPRDNTHYVVLPVRNTLRVAVVDRPSSRSFETASEIAPSRWVRAALAPRDGLGVEITSVDAQLAASRLVPGIDAVFVLAPTELNEQAWDRLARLREQGVMIVVTPDAQNESLTWFTQLTKLGVEATQSDARIVDHEVQLAIEPDINRNSVLAGISAELESLVGAVSISRSLKLPINDQSIASFSDSSPMGVQYVDADGSGVLIVLAMPFDLQWSNLPARPIFVAILQELVRQGVGVGETLPVVLAGDETTMPTWVQGELPIELPGLDFAQGSQNDPQRMSGLTALRDAQGVTRAVRVRTPDAWGATVDIVDQAEIAQQVERFIDVRGINWLGDAQGNDTTTGATTSGRDQPYRFALWMLWAAFVVGVVEFILARFFTARLIANDQAMGTSARGARV
jgi:hypothetical protein